MARTVYYTATSLDGFLADEGHSLEWLFRSDIDPDGAFAHEPFLAGVGALLMGSSTYRWVLGHLEATGEPWTYEEPTWVLTSKAASGATLRRPDGADVRFVDGDVVAVHAEAAQAAGDRDLWVVGGGGVAAEVAAADLLDEVMVSIAPVTLGAGAPLLPSRRRLELIETTRNRDFVCARYAVRGPEPEAAPAALPDL
ncbi:MAG: dihydrofolate reductase family protein [Nocardioides sp.]|nr:dihydrofolate reductase family protein [Nocardioides sp.]